MGASSDDGWTVESMREEKRDEEEAAKEEKRDSILGKMQSSINYKSSHFILSAAGGVILFIGLFN